MSQSRNRAKYFGLKKERILFVGLLAAFAIPAYAAPQGEAPRVGMLGAAVWSSAVKQFFGTAYEAYDTTGQYSDQSATAPISKVWFTGAQGVLTEVYWPTVDTAQVIDSQFMVTDGTTFFTQERGSLQTQVKWIQPGVPAFIVTNTDPQGRFVIEKTVLADPDRDAVLEHVRITRTVPNLQFYALHKPAVGNSPLGDSAFASIGEAPGAGLYAWQENEAQALLFSVPLKEASAGFSGASDGYQDLSQDFKMDYHYRTATDGNVALTGWLDLPTDVGTSEFDVALGFGSDITTAGQVASASLQAGFAGLLTKYVSQWQAYQSRVRDLSAATRAGGELFRASVAALKSMEDKTYPGAFVASPTVPWGSHNEDSNAVLAAPGSRHNFVNGYHVVWPRDLYQMATAMMAIDDYPSAIACLNRLKAVQFTAQAGDWVFGSRQHAKNGSFPQNFWVDGEPTSGGLQLDEVAMPVILAYRLWQAGKIVPSDYWDMVSRAADFINDFGPWSQAERWEEQFGASPSTIAAEISALWVAADFAKSMDDPARALRYQATGDAWSSKPGDNVETWTATSNGPLGSGHYYVRLTGAGSIDEVWNPNADFSYYLANNSGQFEEKAIVDGGFLELVRFGVRSALDTAILNTVPVYDASISVNIPGKGQGFRRYTHDRYNFDDVSGNRTDGMLWPLLTGERGHYELAKATAANLEPLEVDNAVAPFLEAIENFATPSFFIPEQVWDGGVAAGSSTGSATPLGWSHAEYIKLLRSKQDRDVFDRLPVVSARAAALSRNPNLTTD